MSPPLPRLGGSLSVTVEATQQAARAGMPSNPFVIFGGLGG